MFDKIPLLSGKNTDLLCVLEILVTSGLYTHVGLPAKASQLSLPDLIFSESRIEPGSTAISSLFLKS